MDDYESDFEDDDPMFYLPPEFLTNFREQERAVYAEAIKQWGGDCLYIAEQSEGRGLELYGGALWLKEGERIRDLSDFWRVFERVRDEMRAAATT